MGAETVLRDAGESSIACVDIFCGVGGLTRGLANSGISVTAGVDLDSACQYPYEANNASLFLKRDIADLTPKDLEPFFPAGKIRLLAGCAPCQPFSTYARPARSTYKRKWGLLRAFAKLVDDCKPELVTMENVPQLLDQRVFSEFLAALRNYSVWSGVVDCPQYGIPQRRKRLVVLASMLGNIELIKPTHNETEYATVRDAILKMKPLEAGSSDPEDPLHVASKLSTTNLERIRHSKPGGTWRDWPAHLIAKCHRRLSGATFPAVYGRMHWDEPAPTITTQCFGYGNGRFGHPRQDRAISLREASILQTFPENYLFTAPGEPIRFSVVGRLVGNAVPVRLGEVIGKSLCRHVSDVSVKKIRQTSR